MHRRYIFGVVGVAATLFFADVAIPQDTTNPSARDKRFLRSVVEGGNAEIVLGELAMKKSNSEDVRQFGKKIIEDQTHLCDLMRDVAKNEHIRPPKGTNEKDKALEAKLKRLSGPPFDKAYIAATVKDQRLDLDEFNREANEGNDTAIKQAASQGALVIGEQLERAKQIASSHKVEPGP